MTSPLHGEDPVFKSPRAHYRIFFKNEEELLSKLSSVLPEKDIQRSLDTLIGTQKVRRIGPEIIQNNTSHTELPELPDNVKELLEKI